MWFYFVFPSMQREKKSWPMEEACHIIMEVLHAKPIKSVFLYVLEHDTAVSLWQFYKMDYLHLQLLWNDIFFVKGSDSLASCLSLFFRVADLLVRHVSLRLSRVQNISLQLGWMLLTRLFVHFSSDQMKCEQRRGRWCRVWNNSPRPIAG